MLWISINFNTPPRDLLVGLFCYAQIYFGGDGV
nr:MAG TPA: hypothetical protein [Caudoviricetes sp.]